MSVVAAAVVPMTPLLMRHLSGAADPVAGLRAACVEVVREAVAGASAVVVLAPVDGREAPSAWHDPVRGSAGAPLAEQVGRHLLGLAGCDLPATVVPVRRGTGVPDLPSGDVALLVLGDGAAARGPAAPAYVDDRSFPYDDRVAVALGSGDGAALAGLDAELGAELLATGRLTWPVLGALVPHADAELRRREDPFGLTYFVALWRVIEG